MRLKIQISHRIAFTRICSGRFERGMTVKHVRTGRSLVLNRSLQFLAQERTEIEEAFALLDGPPGVPLLVDEAFVVTNALDTRDVPNVTLDLSHTAASGSDALIMATELGSRLAHVHLADGTGSGGPVPDEHLVPGRGGQPCGELLGLLPGAGYPGAVVVEVKTNRAATRDDRIADLAESLAFARQHLAVASGAGRG